MKRTLSLLLLCVSLAPLAQASWSTINRRNLFVFAGKSMTGRIGQADIEALNYEIGHATSSRFEYGSVFSLMNLEQRKSGYDEQLGPGDRNVAGVSSQLFARYHFGSDASTVRPFVELSSGPLYTRYRVPAGTSRFNFISQGGVGVTIHPSARYGFIAAWRFGHISNGGIEPDKNPGYNINVIVVGVQLRPMPR